MKGILLVYAPALEAVVAEALEKSGIKKFTKFPRLLGVGGHSEPHLDTQVWPGSNEGLFIATDEKTKGEFMLAVSQIKKQHLEEGIKAFVFPLEEVI